MAQQPQSQYDFHYQNVELIKTESLGIGSYGAVYKAMCDDLPCAAKILHPALFQFTSPGTTSVMQKFEQECRLLSAIKHPHIVQYLGTYRDPESRLPVLLMELMDESLTRFLERAQEPLPYHTEVNLFHDIALAVSYLHSNGIIHRDLSSNNVLLMAGSKAKVTDFGMVKLYDVNHSTAHLTPLTLCPGTVAYMSPEALGEPPVYTDKLDSFSLSVLGIQIMSRQFPDPGNRFQVMVISDPRIPSGRVQVEVAEVERRQSHISLINQAHPLLPVALDCLRDEDGTRPSCHELCGRIYALKASPMYTASVQQSQVRTQPAQSDQAIRERAVQQSQQIQDLQQQLQGQQLENQQKQQQILDLQNMLTENNDQLQIQITSKDEQLASKDEQLAVNRESEVLKSQQIQDLQQQLQGQLKEIQQQKQQILGLQNLFTATSDGLLTQITSKDEQLASKDEQLAGKDHQLQQKEAEIATRQQEIQQLRQQLQSSEQVAAQFQRNLMKGEKTIQDLQKQIRELQQQLMQRGGQRQEEVEPSSGAEASGGSIKLRWRDGGRAPRTMWGEAAAVNGSVAYFRPGGWDQCTVLKYDSAKNSWSQLPKCPNCDFSLAMVNNLLTAIGGKTTKYGKYTSSLLSITDKKWTEQFPPMPTKRWLTAVACSSTSLVVAGGVGEGFEKLCTVEVMDTETLQWSTASSLPHPLTQAAATICGDQVYMLGGYDQNTKSSKSVFTCALAALLQPFCSKSGLGSGPKVWHQLTDIQVTRSTCVSLHGCLLAVCGRDSYGKTTSAIHTYNTTTNSWEVISHMTNPRSQCLVVIFPHNELMVVGGLAPSGYTDSVEIATIV